MKKQLVIAFLGTLALSLEGCSSPEQVQETPASPEARPTEAARPPSRPGSEATQAEGVGEMRQPLQPIGDGLIPSTDPVQRRQDLVKAKGRPDPFALIAVKPVIKVSEDKARAKAVPPQTGARTPGGVKPPAPTVKPKAISTSPPPPTPATPRPAAIPPTPPPPPSPSEARTVVVSGVVNLGGTSVAIVQAPGERVTRSVRVGETLSNGQVLVTAIYPNADPPAVVLEQYGVRVTRTVGMPPPPLETKAEGKPSPLALASPE